jgi:predicted MPP superfamily phosphohydrolase
MSGRPGTASWEWGNATDEEVLETWKRSLAGGAPIAASDPGSGLLVVAGSGADAVRNLSSGGAPAAASSAPAPSATAATLRIIQITDVYTLENFPSLKTLIAAKKAEMPPGSRTVSMLTGDFLAPYLLSSLDKGKGMMEMCNRTPIDVLTWGNHDGNDLAHADVMAREREYEGIFINSNMKGHESFAGSKCQVDQARFTVTAPDGATNPRTVGMIGVLSDSPSLYKARIDDRNVVSHQDPPRSHLEIVTRSFRRSKPGAFGGAKIDCPWATMAEYKARLESPRGVEDGGASAAAATPEPGVDLVVPLCHLYEPQDERTAREFDFPLILSGHDHHVVDKVVR